MTDSQDWIENHTYDELQVGQSAQLLRTLNRQDILAFAAVSGDTNPAHLDPEYANDTLFHGVIAHGMWGGALISALLGTEFPGPGTIYLQQDLHFTRPVRIGDTLTVTVTVASKDDAHHRVDLDCQVVNQQGEHVLHGMARVLAPQTKVRRARTHAPHIQVFDPQARLQALLDLARGLAPVRCAVVHPTDAESLRGALDAAAHGLIEPVLIGPRDKIEAAAQAAELSLQGLDIVAVEHSHAAAEHAAALAVQGEVEVVMKGNLHSDELLHAIVSQAGLRTGRRMSHVFRFDVPTYPKPLMVTDAALNIAPDLRAKADIVQNAIDLARWLGNPQPKVAVLAAVETVNPDMPATLEAAALCKMAQRGQISGGVIDGPLAFDNAVSHQAARIKHIDSPVAGDADILMVPDIESGNMLAKQLEYLAGATSAGIVMGARVPIALTSRADSAATRVASAVLALLAAHRLRQDPMRAAQLAQARRPG
jgi:phosphate acetyltransferase